MFLGREMDLFKQAHEPAIVSNAPALVNQVLLDGGGIAFYTRLGFVKALASGWLMAGPIENEVLASLNLTFIHSSERLPTVAVRTMAEHLTAELARFTTEWE